MPELSAGGGESGGDRGVEAASGPLDSTTHQDSYDEGDADYDAEPGRGEPSPVDEGDVDYDAWPDQGEPGPVDEGDAAYETLPDGATEHPEQAAQDAARAEVARVFDIDEAREDVAAALAEGPPSVTSAEYRDQAEAWAEQQSQDSAVKEVEFQGPAPAKEVEFQGPAQTKEVEYYDPGGAPTDMPADAPATDVRDVQEQMVVADAKADLVARQDAGEVLGGDPVNRAELWHLQGQNDRAFQSDCALASTSEVLRDCGVDASESDVVDQAVERQLCVTDNDPARNGGVSDGRAVSELLNANGVESSVEYPPDSEALAARVEEGRGVITEVNSGELWGTSDSYRFSFLGDDRAKVDHAVQVTGTVRDRDSGELTGFVVNDTGNPEGAANVIPLDTWDRCWTNTNRDHESVVTARSTDEERGTR
ncbi:MAG: hypothetical protein ACT4P1_11330 [Sporichthyaceae bacterium]